MKKVLVINYSQTGQLTDILKSITSTLTSDFKIEHVFISSKTPFMFPWTKSDFFDKMPETVLNKGVALNDFELKESKYDLIILGYQPWFLSMSLPTSGLFKTKKFTDLLKGTEVITVIGARNMWINAQKDVQVELNNFGAKLIANIPLIDRTSNLLSAITIMHWMFKGKKDRQWGIFPKPGVSDEDINNASKFGLIISKAIDEKSYSNLQLDIMKAGNISIKWNILFIEARAKKLFKIWANLIDKNGTTEKKKKRLVLAFRFYLVFALFVLSPIILVVYYILFRLFNLNNERIETNKIFNI